MKKNKGYSCVEEARKIRQQIEKEVQGMTLAEELQFYKKSARKSALWKKFSGQKTHR